MDRPDKAQRCQFFYCGQWYIGIYSECKDWFYANNHREHNFIRFKDIEEWKNY